MESTSTSSSTSSSSDGGGGSGSSPQLDKSQMFSESARLATFHSWPHSDYKWALPDKMAEAGMHIKKYTKCPLLFY